MLQAVESLLISLRGNAPLPRLLPTDAEIADDAAGETYQRAIQAIDDDNGEAYGGAALLIWMTSFMVMQYGREAVASMALTLEAEQRKAREKHTEEKLKGLLDDK